MAKTQNRKSKAPKNQKHTKAQKSKLTPKQEMFCQEFIVDLNATQAAIRAGYSKKSATTIAAQNLTKHYIADRIDELIQERARKLELSQEEIVRILVETVKLDITEIITVGPRSVRIKASKEWSDAHRRNVQSVKMGKNGVEITFLDKASALDKLMRHLGMYKEDQRNNDDLGNLTPDEAIAVWRIMTKAQQTKDE